MTDVVRKPSPWRHHALRLWPLLLLAACALPARSDAPESIRDAAGAVIAVDEVRARMSSADVILLGEVHDHPAIHATRWQLLRSFVPSSDARAPAHRAPLALVMEHFDVDREAQLDAARRASPRDVDAWIAAGAPPVRPGGGGWPWPLLRPVLELARDRNLPVRAANLPRGQLRAMAANGTTAPSALSADAVARLRATLDAGHCGMLEGPQLQTMIVAQEARDRRMAEAIMAARASTAGPVVLLAGNGHVRRDFGVPAQLVASRAAPQAAASAAPSTLRVLSIGFVERPSLDEALAARAYDIVFVFAPHPREDPCAGLQRTLSAPPKPR